MSEELLCLASTWDIETKDGKRLASGLRADEINPWFEAHLMWMEYAVELQASERMLCIVVLNIDATGVKLLEAA